MTRLFFAAALIATSLVPQILDAQLFQRGGFRARGMRNFAPQQRTPIFQNQRGFLQPRNNVQAQPTVNGQQLQNGQALLGQNQRQPQSVLQQTQNRMEIRPVTPQQQQSQFQLRQANPSRQPGSRGTFPALGQSRVGNPNLTQRVPVQAQNQNTVQAQGLQRIIGQQQSGIQPRTGSGMQSRIQPQLQPGAKSRIPRSQVQPTAQVQNLPSVQRQAQPAIQPQIQTDVPNQTPSQARSVHSILEIPGQTPAPNKAKDIEPILELPEKNAPAIIEETKTSLDITTPPIEPIEEVQDNSILKIVDPPKTSGK